MFLANFFKDHVLFIAFSLFLIEKKEITVFLKNIFALQRCGWERNKLVSTFSTNVYRDQTVEIVEDCEKVVFRWSAFFAEKRLLRFCMVYQQT